MSESQHCRADLQLATERANLIVISALAFKKAKAFI